MVHNFFGMMQAGAAFAFIPFFISVAGAGAPALWVAAAMFVLGCGYYIGYNSRRM